VQYADHGGERPDDDGGRCDADDDSKREKSPAAISISSGLELGTAKEAPYGITAGHEVVRERVAGLDLGNIPSRAARRV
jgi:hypothetical protein